MGNILQSNGALIILYDQFSTVRIYSISLQDVFTMFKNTDATGEPFKSKELLK